MRFYLDTNFIISIKDRNHLTALKTMENIKAEQPDAYISRYVVFELYAAPSRRRKPRFTLPTSFSKRLSVEEQSSSSMNPGS